MALNAAKREVTRLFEQLAAKQALHRLAESDAFKTLLDWRASFESARLFSAAADGLFLKWPGASTAPLRPLVSEAFAPVFTAMDKGRLSCATLYTLACNVHLARHPERGVDVLLVGCPLLQFIVEQWTQTAAGRADAYLYFLLAYNEGRAADTYRLLEMISSYDSRFRRWLSPVLCDDKVYTLLTRPLHAFLIGHGLAYWRHFFTDPSYAALFDATLPFSRETRGLLRLMAPAAAPLYERLFELSPLSMFAGICLIFADLLATQDRQVWLTLAEAVLATPQPVRRAPTRPSVREPRAKEEPAKSVRKRPIAITPARLRTNAAATNKQ